MTKEDKKKVQRFKFNKLNFLKFSECTKRSNTMKDTFTEEELEIIRSFPENS